MLHTLATLATLPLDLGARLAAPAYAHALWAVPAAALLIAFAAGARRRAVRRMIGAGMADLIQGVSPLRRALKTACLLGAIAALAIALARPQFNAREREIEREGRDLVFLVDVSRSMLTPDLAPSRLGRAKIWIQDLVAGLGGDRVALVAFAGAPSVVSPLTLDRAFFELQLERLGPGSAPRGGTAIGDAIRKAVTDVLDLDPDNPAPEAGRFRDIILITDGEDQQSFPVEAARAAGAAGVRIIALGIGSTSGAAVPAPDDTAQAFQTYRGSTVISRLDTQTLESIARAHPGNAFLNIGTGDIDLDQVYRDLIAAGDKTQFGSATVTEYDERFWLFLIAALALLTLESLIPGAMRPTRPTRPRRATA